MKSSYEDSLKLQFEKEEFILEYAKNQSSVSGHNSLSKDERNQVDILKKTSRSKKKINGFTG